MYMAPGMDDGDIISSEKIKIEDDDTTGIIHDKLMVLGAELLIKTLPSIIKGTNKRIKQDESKVTFAKIIKKEDEVLDFSNTAEEVYNKIRGLNPYPAAYTLFEGKRMKIYSSKVIRNNSKEKCGTIVEIDKDGIVVKCGKDAVMLKEIQIEGKKRMNVEEFLNGKKKEQLLNKVLGE